MKNHEVDGNEANIGAPPKNSSHTSSNPGATPSGNPALIKDTGGGSASAWEKNETPSGGGKSKGGIDGNSALI